MIAKYIVITKCQIFLLLGFEIEKNASNWWMLSTYCIMPFFNGVKTIGKGIAKTGIKN